MNLKNIVGLTFLCFLNASSMELATPEDPNHLALATYNNSFTYIPTDLFQLIGQSCTIEDVRNLKLTCKDFNQHIDYHHIDDSIIESAKPDLCTAGISHFIIANKKKNLEKLFKNNPASRRKTLKYLDKNIHDNTLLTHELIEQLCQNLPTKMANLKWGKILSNAITTAIAIRNNWINELDKNGYTSLAMAIKQKNNLQTMNLLLSYKADLHIKNSHGNTPLYLAVNLNASEIVKSLLDNGANPNVQNKWRSTPLNLAIVRENLDIIKILLRYGADLSIKNAARYTPLELAIKLNQPEAITLLSHARYKQIFYKNLSLAIIGATGTLLTYLFYKE